jgi:hypothetical protein
LITIIESGFSGIAEGVSTVSDAAWQMRPNPCASLAVATRAIQLECISACEPMFWPAENVPKSFVV